MPTNVATREHWLTRAQEARALAEQMSDPAAKKAMQDIADSYVRVADRAAARAEQVKRG